MTSSKTAEEEEEEVVVVVVVVVVEDDDDGDVSVASPEGESSCVDNDSREVRAEIVGSDSCLDSPTLAIFGFVGDGDGNGDDDDDGCTLEPIVDTAEVCVCVTAGIPEVLSLV